MTTTIRQSTKKDAKKDAEPKEQEPEIKYTCKECLPSYRQMLADNSFCQKQFAPKKKPPGLVPWGYCHSFLANKCQCSAEWAKPQTPTQTCQIYLENRNFLDCISLNPSDPSKCGLCKPGFKLNSSIGKCDKGFCSKGCKFCTTKECLVCDRGWWFKDSACTKLDPGDEGGTKGGVRACRLNGVGEKCFLCHVGWSVAPGGFECLKLEGRAGEKLKGCRVLADGGGEKCEECKWNWSQVDRENNGECVVKNFFFKKSERAKAFEKKRGRGGEAWRGWR